MKAWRAGWIWTVWLLVVVGCSTTAVPPMLPTAPPATTLQIGVATSATQFVSLVELAYTAKRPFIHLNVTAANSDALLTKLADGTLDAALLHALPNDPPFWFNPVALDGLAILVHPDNPVRELELGQVQGLFNGRFTNWQALGGNDAPVQLVSREQGSGARMLLQRQLMAGQPIHINARLETSQAALLVAVASDPNAVGYGLLGSLADDVVAVAINGRLPTPNEVGTQNYPLTTPLYFVAATPDEPQGALRDFLAWLQSPAAQTLISTHYGRVR